jgi:phospholipid:diacylglycerol acyltransferase
LESRDFAIGDELFAQHGLEKHHPVILVPGIVSTGLESWGTETVARSFFRKRLWVRSGMVLAYSGMLMVIGYYDDDQGGFVG